MLKWTDEINGKAQINKLNKQMKRFTRKSPEETIMDLVVQDKSRVGVVYHLMSEELVRKQIALSYMSFCSDEGRKILSGAIINSFGVYNDADFATGLNGIGLSGSRETSGDVLQVLEPFYVAFEGFSSCAGS